MSTSTTTASTLPPIINTHIQVNEDALQQRLELPINDSLQALTTEMKNGFQMLSDKLDAKFAQLDEKMNNQRKIGQPNVDSS